MEEFPLDEWFDTSKRIGKWDIGQAEAQIALDAVKDNKDPSCSEVRQTCREMRSAVKTHNRKFAR